jgi:anti-sigma factor RsiW
MNCREIADFLGRYLDGDLLPGERAEFDRHLAVCPVCVAYLDGYQKTVRVLHAAAPDGLERAAVPEDLIRAILAAARS